VADITGRPYNWLMKKFELGKTQFNGQQDQIVTKDKYEWKWFFGISLDTRIFNKLFAGGGSWIEVKMI